MRIANYLKQGWVVALAATALVAGCGGDAADGDELIEEGEVLEAQADDKSDRAPLAFELFADEIGDRGTRETRRVFTTAASYRSYFGHAAPASVNFGREWVVFYSAGTKSTGGYKANISKIATSASGRTLKVTTALESPGADCRVTFALTKPFVLAKFRKPTPRPAYVSYYRDDTVKECEVAPSCDRVQCEEGTHCELREVWCVRAPCYPQPQCVPDDAGVTCANARCARNHYCYDGDDQVRCIPYLTCDNAELACAPGAACVDGPIACVTAPCPPSAPTCQWQCPADGWINCMPSVPAERAHLCSGEYHEWIAANCPGVQFAY